MKALMVLCVAALFVVTGCQTSAPPTDPVPADPDDAICELRAAWESAPGCRLYSGAPCDGGGEMRSKAMIRRQAENLAFRHPDHVDTRMFCGVLAFEAEDPVSAVRHLDHVLRIRPDTPEAAVLRARISLEQGNKQHAIRLLEDQARLRPDSYAVREALASAYFMNEDHAGARDAINAAERLGAPSWRTSYNRGLLAEMDGDLQGAYGYYTDAIAAAPDWPMPQERLQGLKSIEGFEAVASPPATPPIATFISEPPPAPPIPAATTAPISDLPPTKPLPPVPAAPPAGFPAPAR